MRDNRCEIIDTRFEMAQIVLLISQFLISQFLNLYIFKSYNPN